MEKNKNSKYNEKQKRKNQKILQIFIFGRAWNEWDTDERPYHRDKYTIVRPDSQLARNMRPPSDYPPPWMLEDGETWISKQLDDLSKLFKW